MGSITGEKTRSLAHLTAFLQRRQENASHSREGQPRSPDLLAVHDLPGLERSKDRQHDSGCLFRLKRQGKTTMCPVPVYKRKLCQGHFLHVMKLELRRAMSMIYKDPASCYATFDFTGKGYVTGEDVLRHPVIKQMSPKYTAADVKAWLERDRVLQPATAVQCSANTFKASRKKSFNTDLKQQQAIISNNK